MKKFITLVVLVISAFGMANAQRASEYDVKYRKASSPEISSYNRIGISYNNTNHMFNKGWDDDVKNFSTNGFGIDYIHGFAVSSSLPMFVELGANVNFGFGNAFEYSYRDYSEKVKVQDINLQVPVNFAYRFNISDDFSIAPYLGINFKLHLLTQGKYVEEEDGEKLEGDWENFFSKDDMGEDETWNRFQMGWQIGATFQYSKLSLGVQYGTDFIPAFSYTEGDYDSKINTGNLKIVLGYNF